MEMPEVTDEQALSPTTTAINRVIEDNPASFVPHTDGISHPVRLTPKTT
jgi:hypothetical protein